MLSATRLSRSVVHHSTVHKLLRGARAVQRPQPSSIVMSAAAPQRPVPPPPTALGQRVMVASQAAHQAMTRHPGVAAVRSFSLPQYRQVLADKLAYFAALEEQVEVHAGHPMVQPFSEPRLRRSGRLAEDLGTLTRRRPLPSLPALRYAVYLRQLPPARLAVHAWVNYLAALFGGQVLVNTWSPYAAALRHVEFDGLEQLRQHCFTGLDQKPLSLTPEAIIDEVHVSYAYVSAMYDAWHASATASS